MQQNEIKSFLEQEFARRQALNKSYSQRAFARDLDISPTSLSSFMSGRRALGFQSIERIFKYLGLKAPLACSWCGTPKKQTKLLISGPKRQFICGQCLDICADIRRSNRIQPPRP